MKWKSEVFNSSHIYFLLAVKNLLIFHFGLSTHSCPEAKLYITVQQCIYKIKARLLPTLHSILCVFDVLVNTLIYQFVFFSV